MDQYREMTPDERQQLVDEHQAFQRWATVKDFVQRLYGPQAKKVWIDADKQGFVHGMYALDRYGNRLSYNYESPFWDEESDNTHYKTWREELEYYHRADLEEAAERRQEKPKMDEAAHRLLGNIYHEELSGCLRPDKDYTKESAHYPNEWTIDYDFDSPPPLSFPNVYIPVK